MMMLRARAAILSYRDAAEQVLPHGRCVRERADRVIAVDDVAETDVDDVVAERTQIRARVDDVGARCVIAAAAELRHLVVGVASERGEVLIRWVCVVRAVEVILRPSEVEIHPEARQPASAHIVMIDARRPSKDVRAEELRVAHPCRLRPR
jgi:hypothetical protein